MDRYEFGNAHEDTLPYRGWLVGHFVDGSNFPIRHTNDVEIKWGVHPAGETREAWVRGEFRTCIVILVSGRFRIRFSERPEEQVVLERRGDYVMWGPGVDHRWTAEDDSVIIAVRWPSVEEQPTASAANANGADI